MIVYHVTSENNRLSILEHGICPSYSRGKREACYFVAKHNLMWAICFIGLRDGIPLDDMVVFTCEVPHEKLKRTGCHQMYYCFDVVDPENVATAAAFVSDTITEREDENE